MFVLVDGKPIFYIGKVNGIGYTSEKDKEILIKQLKEDNPDIEIKDEKLKIDEELKRKAEELAKLKLTYSKSEFMKYLTGEKSTLGLEVQQLKEQLSKAKQNEMVANFAVVQLDSKILELEEKLSEVTK